MTEGWETPLKIYERKEDGVVHLVEFCKRKGNVTSVTEACFQFSLG